MQRIYTSNLFLTMAKQSGIHQLRGKVGEMSYYRQKGVQPGLVRKINQGLSSRVKTEDAYANTRLNNAEFGNACKIASAAFNSVNTRKRGMMRNFAVAQMAKVALEDIKQGTGAWGARMPITELDTLICDLLEKHAKGGAYDGEFGDITQATLDDQADVLITLEISSELQQSLLDLGIDGLQIVTSKCLAGEILVDGAPRLYAGSAIKPTAPFVFDPTNPITKSIEFNVNSPSDVGMSQSGYTFALSDPNHGFYACLTFLPFRQQGANRYTLQEYCTFVAIPLGQIPEP